MPNPIAVGFALGYAAGKLFEDDEEERFVDETRGLGAEELYRRRYGNRAAYEARREVLRRNPNAYQD